MVQGRFPQVATDVRLCRLTCQLLESAWRERIDSPPAPSEEPCGCALCAAVSEPPARRRIDYDWRRSEGLPLAIKTWPFRPELDSVLTSGWSWTRLLNDSDHDLGLRFRYEDDILVFHEYKRLVARRDVAAAIGALDRRASADASVNGARALVAGLFAAYKRSVDEHWLERSSRGDAALVPTNPLDRSTYAMLQLLDCLFWHVPPSTELWLEENLASLILCRVLDDMVDVRADSISGEIDNFYLSSMSTHDKVMYASRAVSLLKYGCAPEAHRTTMWNTWLMPTTIVWLGLTGRHGLWFDGVTNGPSPADDCPLCRIRPSRGAGILFEGVDLVLGPQPAAEVLGTRAAALSARCRAEVPDAWALLHRELTRFEALHGEWRGDVENSWEILRRTYVAAILASLAGGAGARAIQVDSGVVGAERFHRLREPPAWKEDTSLLAYFFGCAHPHFLWSCMSHRPATVRPDWLDG